VVTQRGDHQEGIARGRLVGGPGGAGLLLDEPDPGLPLRQLHGSDVALGLDREAAARQAGQQVPVGIAAAPAAASDDTRGGHGPRGRSAVVGLQVAGPCERVLAAQVEPVGRLVGLAGVQPQRVLAGRQDGLVVDVLAHAGPARLAQGLAAGLHHEHGRGTVRDVHVDRDVLRRPQREAIPVGVAGTQPAGPRVTQAEAVRARHIVVGLALRVRVGWAHGRRGQGVVTALAGHPDTVLTRHQVEVMERHGGSVVRDDAAAQGVSLAVDPVERREVGPLGPHLHSCGSPPTVRR